MVEFCVSVLMAIIFFLRKFDISIIGFYDSMEKETMIKVGMTGVGYWGKHLARNLNELGVLASVIDSDPNQLVWAKGKFHGIRATATIKETLAAGDIDALVIATPPQTHFSIARQALEAGCHVLIEKPFTCSSKEAGELVRVAENKGLVLMGGFTFLYNNAVRKVKEIIQGGELGQVYYVFSQRLNLGRVRSDVDVWWNLAPHDLSIILYWFGEMPVEVKGWGASYLQPDISDVAFMSLKFRDDRVAFIHVSWLDPNKVRSATVVGSSKTIVYDDISLDKKIQLFDHGFDRLPVDGRPPSFDDFAQFQHLKRMGEIHIPEVDFEEPLRVECRHFLECIEEKIDCFTGGKSSLEILKLLEAVDSSIQNNSSIVAIE